MGSSKKEMICELKHQINSPLAAIRNALYLTAVRVRERVEHAPGRVGHA